MIFGIQQQQAFDKIMDWYEFPQRGKYGHFVLSGYAGTGKTTIAKHLANMFSESVVFAAYTGKAAHVLRDKGCTPSGTIHSYLYKYEEKDVKTGKPVFRVKNETEIEQECLNEKLAIVDEYSMLPSKIIEDLKYVFGRILFLGDPFQLPPVKGECTLVPDFTLTQIHRQALDSPILRAAHQVRNNIELRYGDYGDFVFRPKAGMPYQDFLDADQIIVGKNDTRHKVNDRFRDLLGFTHNDEGLACGGEKLICLKNNWKTGIFNGMIGKCVASNADYFSTNREDAYWIKFECDGNTFDCPDVDPADMYHQKNSFSFTQDNFGYGYAITCHKSQGSEFDNVIIYNEPVGQDHETRQRWLYTALTRAKKKAVLINV